MTFDFKILLLLTMFALHIFADFHLQGNLTEMKQINWWSRELRASRNPTLYKRDWMMALMLHSFEWTFYIMLPTFIYSSLRVWWILLAVVLNSFLHFVVDNAKCNNLTISLVEDQTLHFVQIIVTWVIFILLH